MPHWVPVLPQLFESTGLVDVKKDTREGLGYMDYMLHDCVLMAHDMIVRNTNNKEVGQRLQGILSEVLKETYDGAFHAWTKLTVVGRKPEYV